MLYGQNPNEHLHVLYNYVKEAQESPFARCEEKKSEEKCNERYIVTVVLNILLFPTDLVINFAKHNFLRSFLKIYVVFKLVNHFLKIDKKIFLI